MSYWDTQDGQQALADRAMDRGPVYEALHDADEVVGRIRKDGGWDRRYRIPRDPIEPIDVDPLRTVAEILAGVVVLLMLFVGLLFWVAIAGASQVTPGVLS